MTAFLWTMLALHAMGTAMHLVALMKDKPWPRNRKPQPVNAEVMGLCFAIAFTGWISILLLGT